MKYHHPYLTAQLPGCGGTIKESPGDFRVEEIPSYLPSGSGEHCYLTIEKSGITTLEAIRRIAQALKVPERDIGYAGMKDAVGITSQTVSVQWVAPEKALALELEGVRVVSAVRHSNKLKVGHLRGNRFCIVIRGVDSSAVQHVQAILDVLARRGVPNYFGYQRYGAQGNSHLIGTAILLRDWHGCVDHLIGAADAVRDSEWSAAISAYHQGALDEALRLFPRHCRTERDVLQRLISRPGEFEKAFSVVHPRLKKLYLSAAQSFLFDLTVAERIENIDRLMDGDLACKHVNGACFLVEDAAAEAERALAFEISASGPMFGCKMKRPEGAVWELESGILDQAGLGLTSFDLAGGLRMEGERRPLRVPAGELSWRFSEGALTVEFTLPKGSYATSLLREITKTF
ncbi:MAG: tRNA pseudouridine(13) synthase TruD [Desulfuromonadaceae bacterium]|nr:tRNA pseudouridine(13) synthase TruD [Desulfuromonadaceae bacterium]MDD2847798.1 tRNA pseudouridine(13) synthase TruD [Desulfuromonadaceae bacterium]MDD4129657.1 tRNA pseudouridine(13) synthase TruD [Desulfuromonadaceae bacterium]